MSKRRIVRLKNQQQNPYLAVISSDSINFLTIFERLDTPKRQKIIWKSLEEHKSKFKGGGDVAIFRMGQFLDFSGNFLMMV